MEPIGPARGDLQTALIAAVIANSQRDPEAKPDPFTVTDFLPDYWHEREDNRGQTWQEKKAMAEMITTAMGGTVEYKQ